MALPHRFRMTQISISDLNRLKLDLTYDQRLYANELCMRVNALLGSWGGDTCVSSGIRLLDPKRPGSAHPKGAAVDFADSHGGWRELNAFCMKNQGILAELGLYLEHPEYAKDHCHLQTIAPKSGHHVFIP